MVSSRTTAEEASKRRDVTRYNPRFLVVTDFKTLVAQDRETGDSLDVAFSALPQRYDFFLPWAGIERATVYHESPADVKAAEKMAGFYDEILHANPSFGGTPTISTSSLPASYSAFSPRTHGSSKRRASLPKR